MSRALEDGEDDEVDERDEHAVLELEILEDLSTGLEHESGTEQLNHKKMLKPI